MLVNFNSRLSISVSKIGCINLYTFLTFYCVWYIIIFNVSNKTCLYYAGTVKCLASVLSVNVVFMHCCCAFNKIYIGPMICCENPGLLFSIISPTVKPLLLSNIISLWVWIENGKWINCVVKDDLLFTPQRMDQTKQDDFCFNWVLLSVKICPQFTGLQVCCCVFPF